jgi:hypothetical protein
MAVRLWSWILRTARTAAWAPILVFCVHVVTSIAFGGYVEHPWIDIPMHFAGGVAIALFIRAAVLHASDLGLLAHLDATTLRVLVFSLVGTATVFWEFAEFIADTYFAAGAQKGVRNTMSDMFFGLLGGALFLVGAALVGTDRESLKRKAQ